MNNLPISDFYIEQTIKEYKGKENWSAAIDEKEYIKNWCEKSTSNILFLLGEPGHGKSSLCKRITVDFRQRRFFIKNIKRVFYFSLNPFAWKAKQNSDITDIFTLPGENIEINQNFLKYLRKSLIFLDGYDELYLNQCNFFPIENIYDFLELLLEQIKVWKSNVIITSRKTCIPISDLFNAKYKICCLSTLAEEDQIDWINNVYNGNDTLPKEKRYDTEKMYNSHSSNSRQAKVLELMGIPFLLQLIVSQQFYGEAQNIASLYDNLLKETLNTRKKLIRDKNGSSNLEVFKKNLEVFAFDIYKNNDEFIIKRIEYLKEDENKQWKSILLFYLKNEKIGEEYCIKFVHRSFYQYFLSLYFYNLIIEIVKETNQDIKVKKIINLFEAVCWRKIDMDITNMIYQINQNQKNIQNQDQINCILDIFEKTDDIVFTNEFLVPLVYINILYKIEIVVYNLLMILNIILSDNLILIQKKRIAQLIRKFDMSKICLSKSVLSGLNLNKINLEDAYLESIYFQNTYLENANLKNAYLENAHLEEAHLNHICLENANLKNAILKRAYLKRANLKNICLEKTHLEGAHLENAYLENAHLENAFFIEAHLESAYLKKAYLSETHLEKAYLVESYLKDSDLRAAYLIETHLEEACLQRADLRKAQLIKAHLQEANLIGVRLEEANLEGTNLRKAIFDPIILKNAILKDTKISKEKYNEIVSLGIDVNKIIWCD